MTATAVKSLANPLNQLADLLKADMARVNALILHHLQSEVPLIPQIGAYLIASGGKRIRPLLTLASAQLYGCANDRPLALAAAVEFIHTATLLHDDVVDESTERRGRDTANIVFGNQASVLVGDFLFSRAFQLMVADGSLEVLRILSTAAAIIAEGEVLQLSLARDLNTSLADYERVIRGKTAALFAAACEVGPHVADADANAAASLRAYGLNLGIAFQIADDVLDYAADQATLGKTVGDDFRDGKMTAPVILALTDAHDAERAFWHRTLVDRQHENADLATAQDILSRHRALDRGLALAHDYAARARDALATAPAGPYKSLLADLTHFAVERVS